MWDDERLRAASVAVDIAELADAVEDRCSSSSMEQRNGEWW
jgi:hypothetical protein